MFLFNTTKHIHRDTQRHRHTHTQTHTPKHTAANHTQTHRRPDIQTHRQAPAPNRSKHQHPSKALSQELAAANKPQFLTESFEANNPKPNTQHTKHSRPNTPSTQKGFTFTRTASTHIHNHQAPTANHTQQHPTQLQDSAPVILFFNTNFAYLCMR